MQQWCFQEADGVGPKTKTQGFRELFLEFMGVYNSTLLLLAFHLSTRSFIIIPKYLVLNFFKYERGGNCCLFDVILKGKFKK